MAMNRGSKRGRKPYRGGKTSAREDFLSSLPIHAEGAYSSPSLAHTLTTLIGCVVEVQMQTGEVYEGVLRAISPNMDIALSVAHIKGQSLSSDNVYDRNDIKFADVVTISAKSGSNPQLGIFKTDTEISSRANGPQSRKLQPFTDFSEDNSGDLSFLGNSTESGWSVDEMWRVNQTKFKVASNFDEDMSQYTTQLDRSDSESFKQREMRAERLANEIETKDMFSRHGIDDSGTEEERFSMVVRPHASVRPPGKQPLPAVQENGRHQVTTTPTPPPPTVAPHHPLPTPPSSTSVSETSSKGISSSLHGNHQTTPDGSEDKSSSTDSAEETNEGEKPVIMDSEGVPSQGSLGATSTAVAVGDKVQSSSGSQASLPEPSPDPSQVVMEKESGEENTSKDGERDETAKTEQAIKEFKLDPKAKEFVLNPSVTAFVPSSVVPTSRTSPSPSSLQSSPSTTYPTPHTPSHTHTHPPRSNRYTGHRSPRPRTHTPTHVYTPPAVIPEPMLQAGYVLAQQQAAAQGLFRPTAMLQPAAGFPQYTVPPSAMVGGMVAQGVLPSPQIISSNPHAQMMAGGAQQQFAMGNIAQQTQFLQPSQQIITPQGVISPAQPALYVPGMAPQTSMQQQALAAAAAAVPQVPQINPMGQQIVGTTAASVPPRMMSYQMPGTGK